MSKVFLVLAFFSVIATHLFALEVISIPNPGIIDNTSSPSLYNGTIAWHDGSNTGDVFYWDGHTTATVGTGCFAGNVKLYDGKISYQHNEGPNNGVRIYYWNGNNVSNISGNLQGVNGSLYNGKIAFAGFPRDEPLTYRHLYLWDGQAIHEIATAKSEFSNMMPVLDGENIFWTEGMLSDRNIYCWDGHATSLAIDITNNFYDMDFNFSANNGHIAFSARTSIEDDYEIYYWDGVTIHQITDNDINDTKPSLFNGNIAWEARQGSWENSEIYFWNGVNTFQLTDNDIPDISPCMYGTDIAWFRGKGFDGTGEIMYATNVPEPCTVLLLAMGSLLIRRR